MKPQNKPLEPTTPEDQDKPPLLGSWGRLYAVVLGLHTILILLFYFFSRYWS
jgi:hypothetical protein